MNNGQVGIPSTISFSDLYGVKAPARGNTEPTDTERASGMTGPVNSNRPVMFWVSMVVMLILARILWEKGA